MIFGLSSISLLVAGILFFLFSGGIGFVSGWCARGWKHLRQKSTGERLLQDARAELGKVNQLLARKTHDLFTLQASSKSEIDELRAALKRGRKQPPEATSNKKVTTGKSQDTQTRSPLKPDKQAALYSEMAANARSTRQRQGQYRGQAIEQGESSSEFFNSDFSAKRTADGNPDDSKPASSEDTVRRQQQQVISQLMEKNRELTVKLGASQSRQEPRQPTSDAQPGTTHHSGNGQLAVQDDRVVELQLEKIKQLKRQLQEADKFNSKLQARTAEIPDLKEQLNELQGYLKSYQGAEEKFNRLNQEYFNCEEQKVTLQSNNTQLHAQITQLKQEMESGRQAAEQQIAARRLFEQSSNDAANALKEQLARCEALEQEISGFKSELDEKRDQISKLTRQSNERQQFADQLDTLNLQLESDLGRQREIVLQHKEKQTELESDKHKLENETRMQKNRETMLTQELGEARVQLGQKLSAMESLQSKLAEYRDTRADQQRSINRLAEKVLELEKDVQARKIYNTEREKQYAQGRQALQQQLSLSSMLSRRVESLLPLASHAGTFKSENQRLTEKLENADSKIISLQATHRQPVQNEATDVKPDKVETIKKRRPGKSTVSKARHNVKTGNSGIKPAAKTSKARAVDNLKLIHGIGPKLEQLLYTQGITTFKQIADMDKAAVRELAEALGAFGHRIERDKWVSSARKLVRSRPGKAA